MSYLVVFLCGLLTAAPLIWSPLFLLPWFSLVPLFVIAESKKAAYRHGLLFSFGYYGVLYHWFLYLYPMDFADFSPTAGLFIVLLAWFGMTLLQGTGTAFVPFLYRRLIRSRRPAFAPFAAAALWCCMEWLQTQFWFGVPWGRLAVTQADWLPMIQSASLFGSLGLGFLMVLVNGWLALTYRAFKENKTKVRSSAAVALSLFAANLIFGLAALICPTDASRPLTAAAIQGNIASGDKWADDSVAHSLDVYIPLTEEAAAQSGAQLIVWPETVLTDSLNMRQPLLQQLGELSSRTGAYLAVGAYYSETENGELHSYNAIYLIHPDGTVNESVYKKRHLVPFGEYLPMPGVIRTILPDLAGMNLFDSDLTAGTNPALFRTDLGCIGALVCFDSIYETLTLSSVRDGAEIMILSTNDSWYKDSAAVYQHNGHAVLRAVESGRSFVRAANTGISSLITPQGKIVGRRDPLITGYVTGQVTLQSHRTVYSVIGNTVVWLSFGYIFFLSFLSLRDRLGRNRPDTKSRPHRDDTDISREITA